MTTFLDQNQAPVLAWEGRLAPLGETLRSTISPPRISLGEPVVWDAATAVNQLFVIPGPMLHARWAWLPSQLNITPGIILTGLAASAGSAFWHEQLERLQAARQLTETAVQVAKGAQTAVGELGDD